MALNYGSRQEIIYAINKVKKNSKTINENNINKHLYTSGIPEPDILIRTGGHSRLSDFIIYQSTFTELFFTKKLWPDLSKNDLLKIFNKFYCLERKFGL